MLARVLAQATGIFAVHEPQPHLVTEGYRRWKGTLSFEQANAWIRRKRSGLIDQVHANGLAYVESSHYCSHLIPNLAHLFNAKFIFLHRDPRGFVESGLARPDWFTNTSLKERLRATIRRRYLVQYGNIWNDHKLAPPAKLRTRMEKIAWLWAEINNAILRALEHIDEERQFRIGLADICTTTMSQLLTFLECQRSTDLVDSMLNIAHSRPNKGAFEGPPVEWNEPAFRSITSTISAQLGYNTAGAKATSSISVV